MIKTALITGGQQGIGFGIARAMHRAGWQIVMAAKLPGDAPSVVDALAQLPGAIYHQHDLASIETVPAFLDAVGDVDCLVSNAGVAAIARGDLLDMQPDSFDHCMAINLRGTFFLAQHVARRMVAKGQGGAYQSLIFVTSVSAEIMSSDRAEYCISKAGASMMVKSFADRLAPEHIGVFELRPGIIATPMTAPVSQKYDTRIADGLVPARRWGQPGDIGDVVLPLAGGAFGFATGAVIPVDGGLSIHRL
jgi:NAD(P)-dependent dehydrogenase (short-subunit alcohol dehydrogenase family)